MTICLKQLFVVRELIRWCWNISTGLCYPVQEKNITYCKRSKKSITQLHGSIPKLFIAELANMDNSALRKKFISASQVINKWKRCLMLERKGPLPMQIKKTENNMLDQISSTPWVFFTDKEWNINFHNFSLKHLNIILNGFNQFYY